MDPRLSLYNDLKEVITKEVPEVRHFDLWNNNVVFVEQDIPWERPAVFLEFGDIEWQAVKCDGGERVCRGSGEIFLHIVTDWTDTAYQQAFDIGERIWRALERWRNDGEYTDYTVYYPSRTRTNHDHESLLENIDFFMVKYLKRWSDTEEKL